MLALLAAPASHGQNNTFLVTDAGIGRLNAMRNCPAPLGPKLSHGKTATFSLSNRPSANRSDPRLVPRTSNNTNMPPSGGVTRHLGAAARIALKRAARAR